MATSSFRSLSDANARKIRLSLETIAKHLQFIHGLTEDCHVELHDWNSQNITRNMKAGEILGKSHPVE